MTKRLVIVALVMAAALVLAAPAVAFDGYRDGYIPSRGDNPTSCESCHRDGPDEFGVWNEWVDDGSLDGGRGLGGRGPARHVGALRHGQRRADRRRSRLRRLPRQQLRPGEARAGRDDRLLPVGEHRRRRRLQRAVRRLLGLPLGQGPRPVAPGRHDAHGAAGEHGQRRHLRAVPLPVLGQHGPLRELRRLHVGAAVHHRHVQPAGLAVDDAGLDAAADHRLPQHPDADVAAVHGLLQGRGREPAAVERPRSRRGRGSSTTSGRWRVTRTRSRTSSARDTRSSRASSATPRTTVWRRKARSRPSPRPSTASRARSATTRTRRASRPRSGTRSATRSSPHLVEELCVECHNGEIAKGTTAVPGSSGPSPDAGDDGRQGRHRRPGRFAERPQGRLRPVPHGADRLRTATPCR